MIRSCDYETKPGIQQEMPYDLYQRKNPGAIHVHESRFYEASGEQIKHLHY